jgi:hypothetical protein
MTTFAIAEFGARSFALPRGDPTLNIIVRILRMLATDFRGEHLRCHLGELECHFQSPSRSF